MVQQHNAGSEPDLTDPVPFQVDISEDKIDRIWKRVEQYFWFDPPADEGIGWGYGINSSWLRDLCQYWTRNYSWQSAQSLLNLYPQYLCTVDKSPLHYVSIQGEGRRRPLLLLHGWPGSHFEFWSMIERLAFPTRFGGVADDAFDLVIPSLPGYGFSGPTRRPLGPRTAARLLNRLMTDVLGHANYMVQGGDMGAVIATCLGMHHAAHCRAIHLNMIGLRPSSGDTGAEGCEEERAISATLDRERPSLAYAMQHATRPQTLAIGLMDSPVGTAAWILDKFWHWSDLRRRSIDEVYTKDDLLTNVMIYLVNGTLASSLWSYRGLAEEPTPLKDHPYCSTPTAVARFPFERVGATPPRSWVERFFNVAQWTDFDEGGHFAALEQPVNLTIDIQNFARTHFAPVDLNHFPGAY